MPSAASWARRSTYWRPATAISSRTSRTRRCGGITRTSSSRIEHYEIRAMPPIPRHGCRRVDARWPHLSRDYGQGSMTIEQQLIDLASKRGGGGSLLLRSLLVVSLIIVATLFAAELLLRGIDVSGPIRSELGEGFQFDPELGWVPTPNAATQQTSGNRAIS